MVFTATAASLLDGEAFNRLVAEEDLRVWEQDGYIYTKRRGKDGIEVYRTYGPKWRWLYQARRVNTQNAGGGGALTTRITLASGQVAMICHMVARGTASAGAALTITIDDEDGNNVGQLANIAAGATRIAWLPSIGSTAGTHNNITNSTDARIGPGETLRVDSTAGLNTETLTVGVVLLLSTSTEPTWSTTGSAGTPSLADSTISAANTLQAVLLP